MNKSALRSISAKRLFWPLIEAKHLRAGLPGKAAAKNTTRPWRAGDFLSGTLHGLDGRRGINLPVAKVK